MVHAQEVSHQDVPVLTHHWRRRRRRSRRRRWRGEDEGDNEEEGERIKRKRWLREGDKESGRQG